MARQEENPEYRILSVLHGAGRVSTKLPGEDLLFLPVDDAVEDAVPEVLRALGELAVSGRVAEAPAPAPLLEELVISLSDASDARRELCALTSGHNTPSVPSTSSGTKPAA